jgi:recombinational DNA repair ATPase RecF
VLSKLETELVWLGRRVEERQSMLRRLDEYFTDKQGNWSREVVEYFWEMIEKMNDQLYFESSRLEKLAWQVHDERERGEGRDPAFDEGLLE